MPACVSRSVDSLGCAVEMTVYYLLVLWIFLVALVVRDKSREKRNAVVAFWGSVAIILLQALRSFSVGIDLAAYIPSYEAAGNLSFALGQRWLNYEPGYLYFSMLFAHLGVSPQLYLGIVAAAIMVPIGITVKRYSSAVWLSMLLYVTLGLFVFTFSGLRQSIAIAICFFSLRFIQHRKPLVFGLMVALAASFHLSALAFAPAYPLFHMKRPDARTWILLFPLMAVAFAFRGPLYGLMFRVYRGEVGPPETTGAYGMLLGMLLLYACAYVFGNRQDAAVQGYNNLLLVAVFLQMFASESNVIMRVGYYYFIFAILLIPGVIYTQKDKYARLLVIYAVCWLSLMFFQWKTGNGYLNVSPYVPFWD